MNKTTIVVPKDVRFIGTWPGYDLGNYPFPHILDKVLTGCGFTEYCLTNYQNLILCSPRRLLLENKRDQHLEDVFYAKNDTYETISYDKSLNEDLSAGRRFYGQGALSAYLAEKKEREMAAEKARIAAERVMAFKKTVVDYFFQCRVKGKPCKILVTYDSFRHVKEALEEISVLSEFQVVVDEFQSILVDSRFKSTVEIELLGHLKGIDRVCYVSATPMMEEFLDMLDEFKDLPYYELDWVTEDPSRLIHPQLRVYKSFNINADIAKVIRSYLDGNFERESWIDEDGKIQEIVSKEAVIYINSVKTICHTIKKLHLTPDVCNVLCANTIENEKKVRAAFNSSLRSQGLHIMPSKTPAIGSIPGKGEQHKMITLCTRTVYLGADFYSTNARSFIFSDSNIDCLSVDIALDLPQILGRQRLEENPWKTSAEIYVKHTILEFKKEDFDNILDTKVKKTESLLRVCDSIEDTFDKDNTRDSFIKDNKFEHYKTHYVSSNTHLGSNIVPVFNNLVHVAEIRAYAIQQIDYKDRVSIFNTLQNNGLITVDVDHEVNEFTYSYRNFSDKMRYVCFMAERLDPKKFTMFLESIPREFKNYYTVLGPGGCGTCKYQRGELEKEYQKRMNNQSIEASDIRIAALKYFQVGEKDTNPSFKKKMADFYESIGLIKNAKASDLKEWFDTKPCLIQNKETKKRESGLEIVGIKD